jgi:propionate CoA-transferase
VVIVQVERIAKSKSLNPRHVVVPGPLLIRRIGEAPSTTIRPTARPTTPPSAARSSVPLDGTKPMPLDVRKVIARRCALELRSGAIVNLGIECLRDRTGGDRGARRRDHHDDDRGGRYRRRPFSGHDFGAAVNTDAIITRTNSSISMMVVVPDIAFLGSGRGRHARQRQCQPLRTKIAGTGGFINISQNARKLVMQAPLQLATRIYA